MSITEFITFIKGKGVTAPIFPLAFPASSPTEAMIVEVGQGFNSRGSLADITLTVTVRAGHPSDAEALAQDVIDRLDHLTDELIGQHQAVLIRSQQLVPSYLGKDAEGNHFFMANFRVLINE